MLLYSYIIKYIDQMFWNGFSHLFSMFIHLTSISTNSDVECPTQVLDFDCRVTFKQVLSEEFLVWSTNAVKFSEVVY